MTAMKIGKDSGWKSERNSAGFIAKVGTFHPFCRTRCGDSKDTQFPTVFDTLNIDLQLQSS
jgi:hypothetical protein